MGSIPFWDTNADGYDDWVYATNPWDCLTLGAERIPGVVDCSAVSKLALKKSKPSGKHGARVTSLGRDPGEADIKVYISNPKQWDRWQEVEPKIFSGDRRDFLALDAQAPAFAAARVKSVAVISIASPAPGRVPGEKVIVVKVQEYSPPSKKAAVKTPGASRRDEFANEPKGPNPPTRPANARESPPSQDPWVRQP
jgi:hypothetical protein